MLEVAAILLQALFLLFLLILVPIGIWWRSDTSRDADAWLDDAEASLKRNNPAVALGTALQAISRPRNGSFSARQARTTCRAMQVGQRAIAALGFDVPPALPDLEHKLSGGPASVGTLADDAWLAMKQIHRKVR